MTRIETSEGAVRYRFAPHIERVGGACGELDLAEGLSRLRTHRLPVLLDSVSGKPRRFSLLGFDPLGSDALDSGGNGLGFRTLEDIRRALASMERGPSSSGSEPPFFAGGFLGALSYDLGVEGEALKLPHDPWRMPHIVGGLYVDYLVRDHAAHVTWLVLGQNPGDGRPGVAERRSAILDAMATPFESEAHGKRSGPRCDAERMVSPAEYMRRIERARSEIECGEIYQANVSHRLTRRVSLDPIELYSVLRRRHSGPYLGYVSFEHGGSSAAILSGSPELLLEHEPIAASAIDVGEANGAGAIARTRPIKGTAPRGATPDEDRALGEALLASAKDRAELAMIVDLERNDLGRMAVPGGVAVEAMARLESYATVHHLVADISARVNPKFDGLDVLASLFPGGSITGAPKLRSMEVIGQLEGEGRGFAYGSMLMADTCGRVLANILIRTMLWRSDPGEVSYRIGGGITWASDAAAEEAEALTKGLALASTLDSFAPAQDLHGAAPTEATS